jgi:hypothetical protein
MLIIKKNEFHLGAAIFVKDSGTCHLQFGIFILNFHEHSYKPKPIFSPSTSFAYDTELASEKYQWPMSKFPQHWLFTRPSA